MSGSCDHDFGMLAICVRCGADESDVALAEQFNGGVCKCGGRIQLSPYVGGDHDEIAACGKCGKHFGCSECDAAAPEQTP